MSIRDTIISIRNRANAKTGKSDATLGAAVDSLIAGFGPGYIDKWFGAYTEVEKVAQFDKVINLSSDTSFDSVTPTTSAVTLLASAANGDTFTLASMNANNAYINVFECYFDIAYKSTPPNPYMIDSGIVGIQHLTRELGYGATGQNKAYGYGHNMIHYKTSSGGESWNSQAYGLYVSAVPTITLSSTSAAAPVITYQRPAIAMRGSTTYSAVNALKAVDSANTNVHYRNTLYRVKRAEGHMYRVSERMKNMIDSRSFQEE